MAAGGVASPAPPIISSSSAASTVQPEVASSSTSGILSTFLPTTLHSTSSSRSETSASTSASTSANVLPGDIRHPINQSPVTLYSAPARKYRPDHLATVDMIIVVIYLCLLLSTSISTMIRTKKSNKRKAALAGNKGLPAQSNLLAGRKMSWFTVALSIFASNLGSEHFIGLSGSAAANGISVAAFEMNALIILQLATWIFLPVLIVSKISTLPEYMSKRFGGKRIRTYLAVLSILLYIFTKISVNLYSGGIFIQQAIGWNLYSSAMFILGLTCVMTLTGGLKGAMVIDNLQAIVMTIGATTVSFKALVQIGGWEGLKRSYSMAIPSKVPSNLTHCAKPNSRAFQMLRPWDDRDMPWIGFIVGQTPASIWYWAADQMMVQRFLSARSLAHVQGASVFAGYLKILPLLFMVIPGMISRCLFTDEVACIDPDECQKYCQSSVSCSNTAYPRLVLELMPSGARGMMVAAMVAALMGDLCNVFNSASSLFTCDIWPLFRKSPTPKERETAGRVFVIILVLASIMWIPVIQEMQGGQLFIYIQAVAAIFAPPIAAVYICAVLWKRTNETGAFWSLMLGFALGLIRLTMSFMYKEPSCGLHVIDERPWILKHVHYMYYAAFLFWFSIGSCLLISYLTKPPAPFRLIRTTYWTRFDTNIRRDDKNVFEMKYSGATTNSTSAGSRFDDSLDGSSTRSILPRGSDDSSGGNLNDGFIASKSSQQRLFTIEEQPEKKTADLSSVIVDLNRAANATGGQQQATQDPSSAQKGKRPPLQHQASLSASASAAVGAASEAGKFIANKLATEVNLKGAKEMMMAAANHLTGGGAPNSRIRFKNLNGDDEEEEDEEEDDDDGLDTNEIESTMDDEDEDSDFARRSMRQKRNRRSQSVLSAALSSYKQRGGYRKANAYEQVDEDEDDDEEEEDDDDDEKKNLNKSSFRLKKGPPTGDSGKADMGAGSSTDERLTPTPSSSLTRAGGQDKSARGKGIKRTRTDSRRSTSSSRHRQMKRAGSRRKRNKYDGDEDDDLDTEAGRNFRCLDNSVTLLIKTRFEETILRIALVAVILVAIGMFILFSLPPAMPSKQIVDILIKN